MPETPQLAELPPLCRLAEAPKPPRDGVDDTVPLLREPARVADE